MSRLLIYVYYCSNIYWLSLNVLGLIQSPVMWLHCWFSHRIVCLLPLLWCRWLHCWFNYRMVCLLLSLLWCMLISADLWLYSSCWGNRLWSRWFRCISEDHELRTVWYSDLWNQQWWCDKLILMLKNQNIRMKFV